MKSSAKINKGTALVYLIELAEKTAFLVGEGDPIAACRMADLLFGDE